MDKKISLLLMEKDPAACKKMISEIAKNEDVLALAGITNNPNRAMQYVFEAHPDAVILGTGGENDDGTEFLKILKAADIARPPFVLALTESAADGDTAKEYGADFIMCKTADGDTAREAAELLRITAPVIAERRAKDGYAEEKHGDDMAERRLQRRISGELDKLGISSKAIGYRYLVDAISIIMKKPVPHVCNEVSKKYGKTGNSVERAMQNAINRAWLSTDKAELAANYTAKIKSAKGMPTITEFIFYYAQKLNNEF